MKIAKEYLAKATGAKPENAAKYLDAINEAVVRFDIQTPARIAGFLSQIGHESGCLATLSENLNYKVEALLALFGRHRISEEDARRYGRIDGKQPANQEAIANWIYGGEFGRKQLGNTEPGDGWRFRGRGLKQLTGRDNYRRCGEAIGLDLIANPDLLKAMTKVINGGQIGVEQREALFKTAMAASDSMLA